MFFYTKKCIFTIKLQIKLQMNLQMVKRPPPIQAGDVFKMIPIFA